MSDQPPSFSQRKSWSENHSESVLWNRKRLYRRLLAVSQQGRSKKPAGDERDLECRPLAFSGDRRDWPRTWNSLYARWNKVIYIYPTYLSLNVTKNSYYGELKHVWKPLPVFSSVGSLPKEWQRRQVEYFQPSTFQLLWKPLCFIIYSRSLSILSHFSRAAVLHSRITSHENLLFQSQISRICC